MKHIADTKWEGVSNSRNTESTNESKIDSLAAEFASFYVRNFPKDTWYTNADWEQMQDSIMNWFEKKGIAEGNPSDFERNHFDRKKKAIALRRKLTGNTNILEKLTKKRQNSLALII